MSYQIVYRLAAGELPAATFRFRIPELNKMTVSVIGTRKWLFRARQFARQTSLRGDVCGWVEVRSIAKPGRGIIVQYKNGMLAR